MTYPGKAVDSGENVRECYHRHSRATLDLPCEVGVAVHVRHGMAFGRHDGGNDEVNSHAGYSADEEQASSSDAINDGEHDAGGDQENHVLDG